MSEHESMGRQLSEQLFEAEEKIGELQQQVADLVEDKHALIEERDAFMNAVAEINSLVDSCMRPYAGTSLDPNDALVPARDLCELLAAVDLELPT